MKDIKSLKIAYIGGGSRGWAWTLMRDLLLERELGGEVRLYDIDYEAAKINEDLGNKVDKIARYTDDSTWDPKTGYMDEIEDHERLTMNWRFKAYEGLEDALDNVDFVFISILPGTFDEMESDVHLPEKYGIYQPVGDSTGPGGIIRALRTIPIYEGFAKAIKKMCPDAWVINYTNPMTVCTKTLYKVFPEIKAFGCCHEVFGTQRLLCKVLKEVVGIKDVKRENLVTNVVGVNHFTWITKANYGEIDLFKPYAEFAETCLNGYKDGGDKNWANASFRTKEMVKLDLFKRYGAIAAAGDRHLAEFNPGYHYLRSPEQVREGWKFDLTTVASRKDELKRRLEQSDEMYRGEKRFDVWPTGEEGVQQMRALLGMGDMVTNVNIPNYGQIPNLPIGAVVETNAAFRHNSLEPVFAGDAPIGVRSLLLRIIDEQEMLVEVGLERNLEKAFKVFVSDPLVTIPMDDARKLFDEMIENTKKYLTMYDI